MAYDPKTGETPLADLPAYGGAGGGEQAAKYYAGAKFRELFGRNPTASELTRFYGAYVGADPNKANLAQGDQVLAQYFQSQSQSPDRIAADQRAEYTKNAPQHYEAINKLFQDTFGRAASQDELNHFGGELASGTTDAYELQQWLQQQPEYQNKQNEQFRQGLGQTMATNDKRQFQEQILPSIQSTFAKQGRSFDSSGFQAAATNSAQAQNVNRENFLTNLSAQQYGGVQDRAYQDYARAVANQQQLTNQGIQARYQGTMGMNDRLNSITDFNTQNQLYNQYLARYGKRNNGLGGLAGGLAGAGLGAYFGGPLGANVGYQIGSGFGQAAQNSGGSY